MIKINIKSEIRERTLKFIESCGVTKNNQENRADIIGEIKQRFGLNSQNLSEVRVVAYDDSDIIHTICLDNNINIERLFYLEGSLLEYKNYQYPDENDPLYQFASLFIISHGRAETELELEGLYNAIFEASQDY